MKGFFYSLSLLYSRLAAVFSHENKLFNEKFASDFELQQISHEQPSGLLLGVDRFGRTLSVESTEARRDLGNLAIFGPPGSGKTIREIEQLRNWRGSAIVNDPKFQLSDETAAIRKKYSKVYFFAPSEEAGHQYDPLDGVEKERKLFNLAMHLLYVPNESDPAFRERAAKMLTQLLLAAKLAWKRGVTDKRPLPYVAWLVNLGGLNDVAREVNAISPYLAQKLLDAQYKPNTNYEDNKYRISAWDTLSARLYPLLTDDICNISMAQISKLETLFFQKSQSPFFYGGMNLISYPFLRLLNLSGSP
jgi:hypothetical protein